MKIIRCNLHALYTYTIATSAHHAININKYVVRKMATILHSPILLLKKKTHNFLFSKVSYYLVLMDIQVFAIIFVVYAAFYFVHNEYLTSIKIIIGNCTK